MVPYTIYSIFDFFSSFLNREEENLKYTEKKYTENIQCIYTSTYVYYIQLYLETTIQYMTYIQGHPEEIFMVEGG